MPQFGYCLPIFASPGSLLFRTPNYQQLDASTTLQLGRYAEELGFDSLWVADHLMLGKDEAILEGWTTLSALGGVTSRARIGMIHQAHYFREPAIAAKMGATLDQLTGGRFTLFYDYGQQMRENRAYNLPYPDDVDQRVRETVDGVRLIRDMWTGTGPFSIEQGAFKVVDATCTPAPMQQPHPPIWFGETHPGLLAACAEMGQGWNSTPVNIPELQRRLGLLGEACAAAGTSYDDIEKCVEMQILIAPEPGARSALAAILDASTASLTGNDELRRYASGDSDTPPANLTNTTLIGSPDEVTDQIRAYINAGADHFMLWFLDAPDRAGMELFAREVASRFRKG